MFMYECKMNYGNYDKGKCKARVLDEAFTDLTQWFNKQYLKEVIKVWKLIAALWDILAFDSIS